MFIQRLSQKDSLFFWTSSGVQANESPPEIEEINESDKLHRYFRIEFNESRYHTFFLYVDHTPEIGDTLNVNNAVKEIALFVRQSNGI